MTWLQQNIGRAKGVLIAPEVAKAGFIFGGSGGRAVLVLGGRAGPAQGEQRLGHLAQAGRRLVLPRGVPAHRQRLPRVGQRRPVPAQSQVRLGPHDQRVPEVDLVVDRLAAAHRLVQVADRLAEPAELAVQVPQAGQDHRLAGRVAALAPDRQALLQAAPGLIPVTHVDVDVGQVGQHDRLGHAGRRAAADEQRLGEVLQGARVVAGQPGDLAEIGQQGHHLVLLAQAAERGERPLQPGRGRLPAAEVQLGPPDQGRGDRPVPGVTHPVGGQFGGTGEGQLGRPVRALAQPPLDGPAQPQPEQGRPTGTGGRVLGRGQQAGQLRVEPGDRLRRALHRYRGDVRPGGVVGAAEDAPTRPHRLVRPHRAGQVVVECPEDRGVPLGLGQRLARALPRDQPHQVVLPVPPQRRLLQQPHLDQPVQRPGHARGVRLAEQRGHRDRMQLRHREQAERREDPVRGPVDRVEAVPQPVVPDPDAAPDGVSVHAQLVEPATLVAQPLGQVGRGQLRPGREPGTRDAQRQRQVLAEFGDGAQFLARLVPVGDPGEQFGGRAVGKAVEFEVAVGVQGGEHPAAGDDRGAALAGGQRGEDLGGVGGVVQHEEDAAAGGEGTPAGSRVGGVRRYLTGRYPEAAQAAVEHLLAYMPERRMPEIVSQPDRLDQVLVQLQRARHPACDGGRLERVRHARAVVVAGGIDEDLRLALQPPKRLRVHDAVAVALERRADAALVLFAEAAARLVRADGERRERPLLLLADTRGEGVGDSAC